MRKFRQTIGVNGARGGAMFFKGLMALVFGLAFSSPWKIIPPPPDGLVLLNEFIPLEVWGLGWFIAGFALIIGAFRKNQAWSMGLYAAMLFTWFASYLTTAIVETLQGHSHISQWFAVVIYGALLGSAISVARLINAPPPVLNDAVTSEIEVVPKEESGDDT